MSETGFLFTLILTRLAFFSLTFQVSGVVVVQSDTAFKHNGIKMVVDGTVNLQLSARNMGVFDSFYSNMKPLQLVHYEIVVSPSSKVTEGVTEIPFEFFMKPLSGSQIYDTYHGVYENIRYMVNIEMAKGMFSNPVKLSKEIFVELPRDEEVNQLIKAAKPFPFRIAPAALQNVKEASKKKIPEFLFTGQLSRTIFPIREPFMGEITVEKCPVDIKSIEVQLVRVETIVFETGEAREATEIQNIQVADGNIVRGLSIPLHMVFPRLFTCCTTVTKKFRIEFEVNLIVLFSDNHMVTENFPIVLCQ